MMLISIIYLLISVFIQGTISNYLGYAYNDLSIFYTIYPLITLLTIVPYFENKKKYFTLLIIFGLIIDIAYTNTFIFNTCLFITCYYFSKLFHFFFPYNLLTINISNLLNVFLYHSMSFLFLSLLRYDIYSFSYLQKILSNSIFMTVIYSSIIYITLTIIYKKFQLKEVK